VKKVGGSRADKRMNVGFYLVFGRCDSGGCFVVVVVVLFAFGVCVPCGAGERNRVVSCLWWLVGGP